MHFSNVIFPIAPILYRMKHLTVLTNEIGLRGGLESIETTNSNVIRSRSRRHNAETDRVKLMQALNLLHNEQLLNECRRNKADKNPSVTDERPDGSLHSIPSHSIAADASPRLPHHYVDSAAA